MCDIATEKHKIDALLERAARDAPMRDRSDERRLAAYALRMLNEYYSGDCPDECMRRRCEDFAARLARQGARERWRTASAERRRRIA
jgi:hypothetical protein